MEVEPRLLHVGDGGIYRGWWRLGRPRRVRVLSIRYFDAMLPAIPWSHRDKVRVELSNRKWTSGWQLEPLDA